MAQTGTVRIHGLNEVMRGLNKIQRGAHKTVFASLLEAGVPLRNVWVGKLERYQGVSTSTIQPRLKTKGLVIDQRKKKVTGKRGDFGGLQMRRGLEALEQESDNTVKEVEKALDDLVDDAGF